MKNLFLALALTVGISMTGCAGMEKNISADECGCPDKDKKTLLTQQQGISADECGCPDSNQKTKLSKDKDRSLIGD